MSFDFLNTFSYKLIYIFRINDEAHKGVLKIGDTTIHTLLSIDELTPKCKELNQAAKERINSYTSTANITYELLHTELAVASVNGRLEGFRDYDVHRVLKSSGIKPHYFNAKQQNEWYTTDLETAKSAIAAVKEGRKSLNNSEISTDRNPIVFRPEQLSAIKRTISQFKNGNRMLWNAKMRFGKTLTSLEVARRMDFKKTIIFTHRPVVSTGWFDDFRLIFDDDYLFGSKQNDIPLSYLNASGKNYVYFASIQDLRGSDIVGGKFNKNIDIFDNDWDFVIIDEAHEGTTTQLGADVKLLLTGKDTKVLELSGTPYNLISNYKDSEIYTWDYVMEQSAKADWILNNFGDTNPYEGLPRLNIFTYNLNKVFNKYLDLEDKAFNFREFFRVWTGEIKSDKRHMPSGVNVGDFVHESDVVSFLNLITKTSEGSNYPFSSEKYRSFFRHSLWMVPGVKEARALSALLKSHPVFGCGAFNIANVAGDGDEEEVGKEALKKVEDAIGADPDASYSITISCGRLTTGVSVKPWTAVLMLSGSYSTKAATYMQTIFRVQTPATINGRVKEECYVFDFAPDRTLKIIAEATKVSTKAGKTSQDDRDIIGDFLNFCPVISIDGTAMLPYDVDGMLQQLKMVYTDKVVSSGFDNIHIYNDKLLKLDNMELLEFDELKKIIGASKQSKKQGVINVNDQGLTNEEYEKLKRADKKPVKQLTDEEKALMERRRKKQEQKQTAVSILRGIAIRIPLLIYGVNRSLEEDITVDNFTDSIDSQSWDEFMPKGVTKQKFNYFAKYFDPDIFVAAGRKIRNQARNADALPPTERVKRIAEIFSTFKNPDKETVLTPWRVVNMHLGDCLGGWNFYNEDYTSLLDEPRFVDHGDVTSDTLANPDAAILEINSKTGLYPLYVVYSIFRKRCEEYSVEELNEQLEQDLWLRTVAENIYIICNSPMAKQITRRTLVGYKEAKVNARYFEDLINQIKNKTDNFITKLKDGQGYWKSNNERNMKFNAVVGNPPYQENLSTKTSARSLSKQLYPSFVIAGMKLEPKYLSLITPSRWFAGDAQDNSFVMLRDYIRNNNNLRLLYNYAEGSDVFSSVVIKGGVSYFLCEANYTGKVTFVNVSRNNKISTNRDLFVDGIDVILTRESDYQILSKVLLEDFVPFTTITTGRNPFGIVGKDEIVNKISRSIPFANAVRLRCKNNEIRWMDRDNVKCNLGRFDKYKVLISKSAGDPAKDRNVIGYPYIGEPSDACTDSLIAIGKFDGLTEAVNLQSYIRTKFLRYLVSMLKVSQNVYQIVYKFVPLQDFTQNSDIDWSKSVEEIDQQLYKKYNLSDSEIAFIESTIKPM